MPSFNYTQRKPLHRKQTQFSLTPAKEAEAGVRSFDAQIELPDKLPNDARVFVEAYRGSPPARMRFDWGTVAELTEPEDRRLTDFANDPRPPLFRVKVTDVSEHPGRLLADGSQIRATDPDETPDTKRGILYTVWGNNHGPVWTVNFDFDEGPQLVIDEKADPDHQLPLRKEFRALVYPEIIRKVLTYLLFGEDDGGEGALHDDTLDWPKRWLYFPRDAFGFTDTPPPTDADRDKKRDWINDAVNHCALNAGFCKLIAPEEDEDQ